MRKHERGLTIVESLLSVSVFATLMGSIAAGMIRDNQAQGAMLGETGPALKLNRALYRISVELRMAGVWGEDRNHNGFLDTGEDINGNGELDSDWSLEDGKTQSHLAFNTRADLRDEDGVIIATGIYKARTKYSFVDGEIIRHQLRYVDGKAQLHRHVVAKNVRSLTFTRNGGLVKVRASVDIDIGGGDTRTQTAETRVWLRN
ncbi:MAG: hypothetical protein ACYTGZ_13245 [Planctomycetota bacterium]|jgi:hypothetical protein